LNHSIINFIITSDSYTIYIAIIKLSGMEKSLMQDMPEQKRPKDTDYFLFIGAGEKVVFETRGVLNNTVTGSLLLTDKKLFFYFVSNISRDKVFIATYPYIVSVELKDGLANSTLKIKNKKESFEIKKLKKTDARRFYDILNEIIAKNKQTQNVK